VNGGSLLNYRILWRARRVLVETEYDAGLRSRCGSQLISWELYANDWADKVESSGSGVPNRVISVLPGCRIDPVTDQV